LLPPKGVQLGPKRFLRKNNVEVLKLGENFHNKNENASAYHEQGF
jgi:hypothetical protein